jgi:hypothetical protein
MSSSGEQLGSVVPIQCIRASVEVVPHFGAQAHHGYDMTNSKVTSVKFNLNKYRDKQTFHMLSVFR